MARTQGTRPTRTAVADRRARRADPAPRPTAVERAAVALLLLSAVAIVPGALDRFVVGKLLVAAVAVLLAALAPARGSLPRPVVVAVGVGAAVLVVSAATSSQPVVSLLARSPRYEGVLVLLLYVLVAWAGARMLGPRRPATVTATAVDVLAGVALVVAAVAVLEAFGLRPLSTSLDRPGSLLGNASDEGALAVTLVAPLALATLTRPRPLVAAGTAAAVLTVVLSGSRGALVALVLVGVAVAVVRRVAWRYLAGAAVGAVALAFAVPATRDRILGETPLSAQTVGGRGQLWRESLALWADHWPLGIGPSQFETAITAHHDEHWYRTVGPAYPPDSPHAWPLQLLDAGGPLLLAVGVFLLVVVARAAWRARDEADGWRVGAGIAVLGYTVALLFHLTSPGTAVVALLLAGAVVAVEPAEGPAGATTTAAGRRHAPRVAAAVAGGLLAVAFLLAAVGEVFLRVGVERAGRGDFTGASTAFDDASTLRPWDLDLPGLSAHALLTGDSSGTNAASLQTAAIWLDRARIHDDGQVALDRAQWQERRGDLAGAEATLTAQLSADPDNPLLLQRRGVVRGERSEFAAAEADFRRVTAISPDSPEPWTNLATLYDAWGRPTDAAAARAQAATRGG